MCVCLMSAFSPYFQTAQFQCNILIHLVSYVLHVITLYLERHIVWQQIFNKYNELRTGNV